MKSIKKIIINENQRGFLFNNGKFIKMLQCGRYYSGFGKYIEVVSIDKPISSKYCSLDVLLKDKNLKEQTKMIEIKDNQIALHFINGKFENYLSTGIHIFWNVHNKHDFNLIDILTPEIDESIPKYILDKLSNTLVKKIELKEYEKAFLYYDSKFVKLLNCGVHYFWNTNIKIDFEIVDLGVSVSSKYCSLDVLLKDKDILSETITVEVKDEEIALQYINGNYFRYLETGKYTFWTTYDKHEFKIINVSNPEIDEDISKYILDKMPKELVEKIKLEEYEKAFIYYDNKFVKLLDCGVYYFWNKIVKVEYENVNINEPILSKFCSLDLLLENEDIQRETVTVDIKDEQLALHFVNDNFSDCLKSGKYAFWTTYNEHKFEIVDISSPEIEESFPKYILDKISTSFYSKVQVEQYEKALLYFNNKFVRLLDTGTYYFWKNNIKINTNIVDTRLTQMNITGQEILTQDKVSLRINFVCNYKVTDYIKIFSEIDNYEEQIHISVQLALREFVGKYKIDEILENKDQISTYVFEKLKEKEETLYVYFEDAGVKDIILPGEIREIMNTVLLAEKKAQANVITRREEVASTRSLLNTAKLMEENKILYKLKELEYIERISENVGNINLNGGGDLLTQLTNIISREKV